MKKFRGEGRFLAVRELTKILRIRVEKRVTLEQVEIGKRTGQSLNCTVEGMRMGKHRPGFHMVNSLHGRLPGSLCCTLD